MSATALDLASDLGERFRHEGDKQLHRLEALTHPKRTALALAAKRRRRRMSLLSLAIIGAGIAFAMYRARREPVRHTTIRDNTMGTPTDVPESKPTVRAS